MPDLPGPHRSHDLARVGEDGIPRKAGHDAASAVHAGHSGVFLVAAQLQGFGDEG